MLLDRLFHETDNEVERVILDELAQGDAAPELRRHIAELEGSTEPINAVRAQLLRSDLWLRGFGRNERESVAAAIEVALDRAQHEPDAYLEDRLAGVTGHEQQWAADHLRQLLQHADAAVSQRAYALLGRLRLRGSVLWREVIGASAASKGPRWRLWAARARLAAGGSDSPAAIAARRLRLALVSRVNGWALVAAIVLGMYIWGTSEIDPAAGFYFTLMLGAVIFASALALPAVRAGTPIYLHYDRRAAAVVQPVLAAMWTVGFAAIAIVGFLLATGFNQRIADWIVTLAAGCLWFCGTSAAARAGTIVALTVPRPRPPAVTAPPAQTATQPPSQTARQPPSTTRRWIGEFLNRPAAVFLIQVAGGASFGIAFATILLLLYRRTDIYVRIHDVAMLIEGLWLLLVPVGVGLAGAFAAIDRTLYVPEPGPTDAVAKARRLSPFRLLAAAAVALPLLAALGLIARVIVRKSSSLTVVTDIAAPRQSPVTRQFVVTSPTRIDFRVAFPQRIRAEVPQQREGYPPQGPDFNLSVQEWTPSGRNPDDSPQCYNRTDPNRIAWEDDPPLVHTLLGWGCYSVEVNHEGQFRSGRLDALMGVVEDRIRHPERETSGERHPASESATYLLELVLNVDRSGVAGGGGPGGPEFNGMTWMIDALPATRRVTIAEGTVGSLSVTPEIYRAKIRDKGVVSSAPRDIPVDREQAATQERRVDISFTMELVKHGQPAGEPTGNILDALGPGTYDARITADHELPEQAVVALNLLTRRQPAARRAPAPPPPPAPVVIGAESAKVAWPITQPFPAFMEFELRAPQLVRAAIKQAVTWQPFEFDRDGGLPGERATSLSAFVETSEGKGDWAANRLLGGSGELKREPGKYRFTIEGDWPSSAVVLSEPALEVQFTPVGRSAQR